VRLPAPEGLLVDHPALAVPVPAHDGLTTDRALPIARFRLGLRKRLQLAIQLTAAAALLAEFDLWPGRRALASAGAVEVEGGLQVVIPGFAMPLSRLFHRLGGGEGAADATREAVAEAVAKATGLEVADVSRGCGPGFSLSSQLERLIQQLPKPIDRVTARNLWALRWEIEPVVEEGELVYWSVPDESLAFRLGAACWCRLRRRGQAAILRCGNTSADDTGPLPAVGVVGPLVLAGRISREDLALVGRWAGRSGCNAIVVGVFPEGWRPPPPPGFDSGRLSFHLAVTGASLERCRKTIDARRGRFDPHSKVDRGALIEAGRRLWEVAAKRPPETTPNRTVELLELVPDGLPEGFLLVHTGRSPDRLRRDMREQPVVVSDGHWRLATPVLMRTHPVNAEIADLFDRNDPRRLRHRALADGDPSELVNWARRKLAGLDGASVRSVLSGIGPGVLGSEIQLLLVEACLSEMDLTGAREALCGLSVGRSRPWRQWLEVLDGPSGHEIVTPTPDDMEAAPRACAEIIRVLLRRAVRQGEGDAATVDRLLGACRERLLGDVRRLFDLETVAIVKPHRLADRSWRRDATGGNPTLVRRLMHLRALQLIEEGQIRVARRMLNWAIAGEDSAARHGLVQLDLGYGELKRGRSRRAADHLLRAYRLLQAAGFERKTRLVLFDLAVCDIDLLRVERARMRLLDLESMSSSTDAFVLGEKPRLALAVGDERLFCDLLEAFAKTVSVKDDRFGEQLSFLKGVRALLENDLPTARRRLAVGGQEGRSWMPLIASLEGRRVPPVEPDDWGVGRAAVLILGCRSGAWENPQPELLEQDSLTLGDAMAVGLAERFAGPRIRLQPDLRARAAAMLAEHGLTGWARVAGRRGGVGDDLMGILADMVEHGGVEKLDDVVANRLPVALGLTGLEVRNRGRGDLLWRVGQGPSGPIVELGRFVVKPLGGVVGDEAGWRLLFGILDLLLPEVGPTEAGDGSDIGLHGVSKGVEQVRAQIREMAPTGVAVLLQGDTGVGKEVAAMALHRLSGRIGRLVPVNVAAMPGELLETEIFGSVRGAFTGADQNRKGLADAADGGTLFLDEIGDLDPRLQAKLLRFLETGEVRPVGSDRFHRVDVRIVSATHMNLQRSIEEGRFRNDLYYRVASISIVIPPLRDRPEDIPILRNLFEGEVADCNGLRPRRWSRDAEALLASYSWPGNVRELRHVVEVAVVRAAGGTVMAWHLPIEEDRQPPKRRWHEAVAEFRRRFLTAALQRHRGNRSATARELGITRQALLYHIRNLGLRNVK